VPKVAYSSLRLDPAATTRPLHRWRRRHGAGIVAQVTPIEGIGQWDVSAWLVRDPSAVVATSRKIGLLMSAQAAADHLARTAFDHTCHLDGCGDWMVWPSLNDRTDTNGT
jgi:hypothetical protein